MILREILPEGLPFDLINKTMNKREIRKLVSHAYRKCGIKNTVIFADQLKNLGYKYATQAGISISIKDMVIPSRKPEILSTIPDRSEPGGGTVPGRSHHRRGKIQ